jgi:hypothetical protein
VSAHASTPTLAHTRPRPRLHVPENTRTRPQVQVQVAPARSKISLSVAHHRRFVGQSILVSPPRRPLWARLAAETVARYGSKCYETMNTGTHLTTELWNKWCIERDAVLSGVVLQSMSGVVTWHHTMNNHSWMPTTTSSRASLQREAGKVGCPFRRTRTPRVKCTGG